MKSQAKELYAFLGPLSTKETANRIRKLADSIEKSEKMTLGHCHELLARLLGWESRNHYKPATVDKESKKINASTNKIIQALLLRDLPKFFNRVYCEGEIIYVDHFMEKFEYRLELYPVFNPEPAKNDLVGYEVYAIEIPRNKQWDVVGRTFMHTCDLNGGPQIFVFDGRNTDEISNKILSFMDTHRTHWDAMHFEGPITVTDLEGYYERIATRRYFSQVGCDYYLKIKRFNRNNTLLYKGKDFVLDMIKADSALIEWNFANKEEISAHVGKHLEDFVKNAPKQDYISSYINDPNYKG